MTAKKIVLWDDDDDDDDNVDYDDDMQSIDLEAYYDENQNISKKCCFSSVKSVCSLTSFGYLILVVSLFGVFVRAECEIMKTILGHWILLIVTVPIIFGVMKWVHFSGEKNYENVLVGHDYLASSLALGRDVTFISECEFLEQSSNNTANNKVPSTMVVQVF